MRSNKNSAIATTLAAALAACSLAACGGAGGTPSSRPDEVYPEYENNKSMWIGGWDEPLNTEADYKLAKEMGLTHMFIDGFLEPRHSEGYFKQLENCEKAGLKAIVGMDTALKNEGNMPYDETDFSVYPAVDMINLWDEPFVENFDAVAERVARANAQYAGKDITLFINFLPGSPGGWQNYIDDMWEKCLSKVNGRKIYSTDIYPLNETRGEYYVSGTWLSRLNMMARAAKNNGGEFHMFIQSYTEQGVCRDLIGREDLTFQIYTDMAFGINGFTYFTYRKSFISGFGGGCVENNVSATPTQIWYWAKEVNEEIAAFDHVYLSFDWDGVYTVNGQDNLEYDEEYENPSFMFPDQLEALDCTKSVRATQDTLIGQFKDGEGRDGLMVVNFTDPTDGFKDKVSFEFKDANRALVYRNGVRRVYEVKDGKLDLNLATGEGVFVIPCKV